MSSPTFDLRTRYNAYATICDTRDWSLLPTIIASNIILNSSLLGLENMISLMKNLLTQIPDFNFTRDIVVVDPTVPTVAVRVTLDCTPIGEFMGLLINGRRVKWVEHTIYRFDEEGKIGECWFVADKATVEKQLKEYDERGEFGAPPAESGKKKKEE